MHRRQRWAPRPPPRAWARSAASSAPRTRISCLCPTRTTPVPAQSRRPRTRPPAYCRRGSPGSPPADRPVLGGDHPARPVPVHREHRIRHHLPLHDRPGGALTLLGSTPADATGGRVSADPDLPAVRIPDRSHPGHRRHRVFHGGRNTSSTFRTWLRPASRQACRQLPHWLHHQRVRAEAATAIVPGVCART